MESILQLDERILLFFNGMHSTYFDYFMSVATGRLIWVPFYIALLILIVQKNGIRRAATIVVGVALAITLADQLCATVLRPIFARYRPANQLNPLSEFIHIVNGYRGGRYGFPSCHAANCFAVLTFLSLLIRNRMFTISMLIWALINCYSRMYLGVHYPGDLIAGAVLGYLCGLTMYAIVNKIIARIKIPSGSTPAFNSLTKSENIATWGLTSDIALIMVVATVQCIFN